jgi:hypothetical protein
MWQAATDEYPLSICSGHSREFSPSFSSTVMTRGAHQKPVQRNPGRSGWAYWGCIGDVAGFSYSDVAKPLKPLVTPTGVEPVVSP